MNGVDTIRTERDERKSEERQYQRRQEGYDRMEGWLADKLEAELEDELGYERNDELEVSSDDVVKAERTNLDEGDTVLYVGDEESTEAYVLQEQIPNSVKGAVAHEFGTYREERPTASGGIYDGDTAEEVAAYKNADIAIGSDGEVQRRDESTVVDVNAAGSELESGNDSERLGRMLERHEEEDLRIASS
jgi:hypothetical protein